MTEEEKWIYHVGEWTYRDRSAGEAHLCAHENGRVSITITGGEGVKEGIGWSTATITAAAVGLMAERLDKGE